VKRSEPADAAASRLLEERTGIGGIFFKQYHTFTDPDRSKVPGLKVADFSKGAEPPAERIYDVRTSTSL